MKSKAYLAIAGALIAILYFSCKKEMLHTPPNGDISETQNVSYPKILKSGNDDHDTTGFHNAETTFADTLDNIPTTNISVFQGMLYFSSFTTFSNTFSALVNKREDLLDNWIGNFSGFKSLRGYYNSLLAQPSSDHYLIEISRIQDPYIEILLSEEYELRIADTIYSYNDSLTQLNLFLVEDDNRADTAFASKRLSICPCGESTRCNYINVRDQEYGNIKKLGAKWVYNIGIAGSVGFKSKLQARETSAHWWKNYKDRQMNTFIDQYYELRYWDLHPNQGGSSSNPRVLTNHRHITPEIDFDTWVNESVYDVYTYKQPGFLGLHFICVEEFGRTHNWNANNPSAGLHPYWESDAHNDDW